MLFTKHAVVGWLFIAQPQSSSTSTMINFGSMAGLHAIQQFPCRGHPCFNEGCYARSSVWFILLVHSDVCEHYTHQLEIWIGDITTIFKQHIPPTPHNRGLVLRFARESGKRVVILTRDAYEATHGFCERRLMEGQLGEDGLFRVKNHSLPCDMEEMMRAMKAWGDGWSEFARQYPQHARIITYEEMLIADQREAVLSDSLEFYQIPKVQPIFLAKERYVHQRHPRCDDMVMPPASPVPPPRPQAALS